MTKYTNFAGENNFAAIVDELSVLKMFQLSNGVLILSWLAYILYKVREPRMTKLGQGRPKLWHTAKYVGIFIGFMFCLQINYLN